MKSLVSATTNRLQIKINMLSSLRVLRRYHVHGSAALTTSASYYNQTTSCFKKTMANSGENQNQSTPSSSSKSPITYNPKVNKFQQVIHSEPIDGWDKCWEQGLTPWDLGQPTPVLVHLHNTGSLPNGNALIPGCGTGYDVVAVASAERHVTGLDISDSCIGKAKELFRGTPNAENFTFLKADFFTWSPAQLFDLIFDYTFFCAIEPELRPLWARRISDLLKPEGELITLIYPIDDHEGGPPFKVSVSDYEDVLHPAGFIATYIGDNDLAVAPRMGREKLGRWKRSVATQSSL